ncbi:MAG: hypothetical protein ACI4XS_05420 [Bacillus sp. (in: firmicutes)]
MLNIFTTAENVTEVKQFFVVFKIVDLKSESVLFVGLTNYSLEETFSKLAEEAENNSHVPICKYIHNVPNDSMKIEAITWTDDIVHAEELKHFYTKTLNPAYNCEIGMTYIRNPQ